MDSCLTVALWRNNRHDVVPIGAVEVNLWLQHVSTNLLVSGMEFEIVVEGAYNGHMIRKLNKVCCEPPLLRPLQTILKLF